MKSSKEGTEDLTVPRETIFLGGVQDFTTIPDGVSCRYIDLKVKWINVKQQTATAVIRYYAAECSDVRLVARIPLRTKVSKLQYPTSRHSLAPFIGM